jgi:chemotaxis protein MotB
MKRIIYSATCIIMAGTMLTSCVAKKKYIAARIDAKHQHEHVMQLQDSVSMLSGQVNRMDMKINDLNGQVGTLGDQNNMSKEQIAAQRQRLTQLQGMIDAQQKNTEMLRSKIADALVGFNTNELTVSMRNGKVYVSLQESLLFPSGSAVVNPKGKEALSKLAAVLNTNQDINVDVEGHTDSVKIHNKMFADNWQLSTARAVSIAHVLTDEYSVNPGRLIASGRSQYDPVADNGTADGRAKNRRTEIILEPKLDELMSVINGGQARR